MIWRSIWFKKKRFAGLWILSFPNEREWIRIFQKKCFEEKTFAQIAEEMDLAESTVKTRFYQMLKRIRQEVQR